MEMCTYQTLAIRVNLETLGYITKLNAGMEPELEDVPTHFMLYCFTSDHEESEIINEETYTRTYDPMPEKDNARFVTTID